MFQAQKDVAIFMQAAGLHIGNAAAGYTDEQRQQIDQIIGGLTECFQVLGETLNAENDFVNMCEAMMATHWQLLMLSHAVGVPVNACWLEYRRSAMQCINPRTGKLYEPGDEPKVPPCDMHSVLVQHYGE